MPVQAIYGYNQYELMVGQQGDGPLPARLWRVRLADMELLGFVFLQLSSFTDPNQVPLSLGSLGMFGHSRFFLGCPIPEKHPTSIRRSCGNHGNQVGISSHLS